MRVEVRTDGVSHLIHYALVALAVDRSADKRLLCLNVFMAWTDHRLACRTRRSQLLILGMCSLLLLSTRLRSCYSMR
jgi:hypothetical protein